MRRALSVLAMFGFSLSYANLSSGSSEQSNTYVGVKLGYAQYSDVEWRSRYGNNWMWSVGDDVAYSFYAGYKLNKRISLELEYVNAETQTEDREVNDCGFSVMVCYVETADSESNSYAVYGVYRSAGKLYFKSRLGFIYLVQELSTSSYNTHITTLYESGFSGSLGAGYSFGDVALEAEYTYLGENINYISAGLNFNF